MAFFDQLSQKLTQTSQDAMKKTKDMTEVIRLNNVVSEENKKLEAAYREIGKLYYEHFADSCDPVLEAPVAEAKRAEASIKEMRETIARLKGIQICPNCGSELAAGAAFCNNCGAKQPDPPPPEEPRPVDGIACPGCGTIIPEDMAFCTNCGTKRPDPPAPEEPKPADDIVCPACGTTMPKDMAFCTNCGAKLAPPAAGGQPEA